MRDDRLVVVMVLGGSGLEIQVHLLCRSCLRSAVDRGEILLVLLFRLDTILCRLVIDRVVHRANLLVVTVSL